MKQTQMLFRTCCAVALTTALLLVSDRATNAAPITWTTTLVDSNGTAGDPGTGLGDAAVSTNGALVEAANFGTTTDVTVNGVLFNGVGFTATNYTNDLDTNNASAVTGTTTGGSIDTLTSTFARNDGDSTSSGMLTGLIIGNDYEVQLISAIQTLSRTMTFDDGLLNAIATSTDAPQSFATGTFTADATTQDLNFTANTGSSFISAYQLRNLSVPEPASIAIWSILGIVSLLTALRMRRQ